MVLCNSINQFVAGLKVIHLDNFNGQNYVTNADPEHSGHFSGQQSYAFNSFSDNIV